MAIWKNDHMKRRHFMQHVATATSTLPAHRFLSHVNANSSAVRASRKACILLWMGGGPPSIDIFDLKPGSKNGGEFKPVDTAAPGIQICEHMPETAKVFGDLSLVLSMNTREADHNRGRYYMHTSFVPNQSVTHPSFGSVVSYELSDQQKSLEIPAFVSIGGPSGGAGFLGMAHAPFVVDSSGRIRNEPSSENKRRLEGRLAMLRQVESSFIKSGRGDLPKDHLSVYQNAVNLMQSPQMAAFNSNAAAPELGLEQESSLTRKLYGQNSFGQGLLMARRLAQVGVPFIEVNMGGWDLHQNLFPALRDQRLPQLDKGLSALVVDLKQRGMLDDVVLVWMGEFGRTPRVNQNGGRDHWAKSWTTLIGGGGLNNGQAIGATDQDGVATADNSKSYLPGDIWATVAYAMGIPMDTVHTAKNGRPMPLVNGGSPVKELIS